MFKIRTFLGEKFGANEENIYDTKEEAFEQFSYRYEYLRNAYLKGRINEFEISITATQEGVD